MSVAFLILAHEHPDHLARLVERLSGPGARLYIHIDRKVDRSAFEARLPGGAATLLPIAESVPVYWGGFNIMRATMAILSRALEDPSNERFCVVSGVDYPVAPRTELLNQVARPGQQIAIERRLSVTGTSKHDLYVRYIRFQDNPWTNYRSSKYLRRLVNFTLRAIPRRPPPNGFGIYHGAAWWVIDRRAARLVLDFMREKSEVTNWFKLAAIPDEMLVHSILKQSPLAGELTQDWLVNTRPAGARHNVYGVHYIDWAVGKGGSPKTLTLGDLDTILASGAVLARKFDPVASATLLDALDRLA